MSFRGNLNNSLDRSRISLLNRTRTTGGGEEEKKKKKKRRRQDTPRAESECGSIYLHLPLAMDA